MKALIVDLDGTLLHDEKEEIPVPGFSGVRYMARKSAELLADISRKIPVVIATGRNARSVAGLTEQLPDISFSGFVLENGLIARNRLLPDDSSDKSPDSYQLRWDSIARQLPGWQRFTDYESCLGLRIPRTEKNPTDTMKKILAQTEENLHLYLEPGKMFVYPYPASKLTGVQSLSFHPYIVLGDETNDLDVLRAGRYAGAIASAHAEVLDIARQDGNFFSEFPSHKGTAEMLQWAGEVIRK